MVYSHILLCDFGLSEGLHGGSVAGFDVLHEVDERLPDRIPDYAITILSDIDGKEGKKGYVLRVVSSLGWLRRLC